MINIKCNYLDQFVKNKIELIGLTPDKFPKVADFNLTKFLKTTSIPESFTGKKGYRYGLKNMPIKDTKLENFQRIIFALARQIPSNWKSSKILIPYDDFICNYIYYFIDESYNLLNVVEEHYSFAVDEILRPLLKLYKSKQKFSLISGIISAAETRTQIQKKARSCGMSDAQLAYELSSYHIMYAPNDLRRSFNYVPGYVQCEKLKEYILKNFTKLEKLRKKNSLV